MTNYRQEDYTGKLGFCNVTIATDGCFITSLGILSDTPPDQVNSILKSNDGYSSGCLVIPEVAAQELNLNYDGKVLQNPNKLCIAETNFYKSKGYPQHFFVLLEDGHIIDPLIGYETSNHYENNMVSFRLFSPKGEKLDTSIVQNVVNGFYLNYYFRTPGTTELNNHVVAIMSDYNARKANNNHPEYALSDWINRQTNEAEFKKNWTKPTSAIKPKTFTASIQNGNITIQ